MRPSHWRGSPGWCISHPSSASVQFDFALLRTIEVHTQFVSSSAPPRATGMTWSTVGKSSQNMRWLSVIFQLGCAGNSPGNSRDRRRRVPGKTSRSPEYRSTNPSRQKTRTLWIAEHLRPALVAATNGYSARAMAVACSSEPPLKASQTRAMTSVLSSLLSPRMSGFCRQGRSCLQDCRSIRPDTLRPVRTQSAWSVFSCYVAGTQKAEPIRMPVGPFVLSASGSTRPARRHSPARA